MMRDYFSDLHLIGLLKNIYKEKLVMTLFKMVLVDSSALPSVSIDSHTYYGSRSRPRA